MSGLAALQYHPASFDLRVGKLMGRQVASETFLRAWIAHSGADPITGWVDLEENRDAFVRHVREMGASGSIKTSGFSDISNLMATGALWLGDPNIGRMAWHRRWYDQRAWSIVGITHTICTHDAMDRIVKLVHSPTQSWDALICTSSTAKEVVVNLMRNEAEYLRSRFNAQNFILPNLPVIPLGVDCDSLQFSPQARAKWRKRLGISDDDIAVLQFGRLSLHGKAHPLPLYLALSEAARRLGRPFHLILAGQNPGTSQADDFRAIAKASEKFVVTHMVDGAQQDAGEVRSAADIGALLSDNIQETFGLSPVELMAAGLPMVASDWNGLKDTIKHGVNGFRATTVIPPARVGEFLALRYERVDNYDTYLGGVVQSTAIDIGQAADAFELLARDSELRKRMGEAARQHAKQLFDWPVIIRAYRALLQELAAIRTSSQAEAAPRGPGAPAEPNAMDPFKLFESYPTKSLSLDTMLVAGIQNLDSIKSIAGGLRSSLFHGPNLISVDQMDHLLEFMSDKPISIGDLCKKAPNQPIARTISSILWLIKFGFIALSHH
jgi:starch synthase